MGCMGVSKRMEGCLGSRIHMGEEAGVKIRLKPSSQT